MKKSKKLFIILVVAIVILLLGSAARFTLKTLPEEYDVTINYILSEADEPFEVYSEKHENGEQIIINSPVIEGYTADKENIAAVVKSNLYITVTYNCLHVDGFTETVLNYPTSDTVGKLLYECPVCSHQRTEEFTTLSRTLTFGGEALDYFTDASQVGETSSDGYRLDKNRVVLMRHSAPEFDIILDEIEIDSSVGLDEAGTVTFEYDESVWGEDVIELRRTATDEVNTDYSIRIAEGWAVIFSFAPPDRVTFVDWVLSPDCPLRTSPIEVTLTYDFTK